MRSKNKFVFVSVSTKLLKGLIHQIIGIHTDINEIELLDLSEMLKKRIIAVSLKNWVLMVVFRQGNGGNCVNFHILEKQVIIQFLRLI